MSYPFLGSGSTGYPDAAAVLRSYFGHPALEVVPVTDELDDEGDVVFGEPHLQLERDIFSVEPSQVEVQGRTTNE